MLTVKACLGRQGGRLGRLHPEGLCQYLAQLREEQRLFAEGGHTGGARLLLDIRPVVGGQDNDGRIIVQAADLAGDFDAVHIRSLNDDTPIIILTAYDWSDIEVEAKAAGVTAFCSKPMFMSDLRETLMSALGQNQTDAAQELLPQKNADFKGRHILLVEDNELNREIAQEILREYGFRVDTAENGAVAVEKVSTAAPGSYDLVLMDVQMPVMDGYTATRQIRALGDPALAKIPILAMTANAFDEDRRNALESGMNGFLSKPIVIGDLVQELRKIL